MRGDVAAKAVDAAARAVIEPVASASTSCTGLVTASVSRSMSCPAWARRATGQLLAGSVITIEPGIYVPDFGGVRIEDLVVVEPDGARVLTSSPKSLVEV